LALSGIRIGPADPGANILWEDLIAVPENATRVNDGWTTHAGSGSEGVVFVYATFPDLAVAEAISGDLVSAGLAACANLTPGMRSVYGWQGQIERADEVAAIFKTRRSLASRVVGWLCVTHPYVNPAAVVLPAIDGSEAFLAWITAETERAASE
jgi:periplasmic divalent cation tolerance protein